MRKIKYQKNQPEKHYLTTRSDCKGCPIAGQCLGKSHEKRLRITLYKEYYDRAKKRAESRQGRYFKTVRQSTVEPVFGTLINFLGMRKINTRGIENANKVMLMAAIAYNLKKVMKYQGRIKEKVRLQQNALKTCLNSSVSVFINLFETAIFIFFTKTEKQTLFLLIKI